MFKKIEIWVLYLVIIIMLIFALFFGVLVRQEIKGDVKLGYVSKAALILSEIPMNLKKIFYVVKDKGVDLSVTDRFQNLNGFKVSSLPKKELLLLLSRYDGDKSESIVELIDLSNLKKIHEWNPDIKKFNNLVDKKQEEWVLIDKQSKESRYRIYHPLVTVNGELIFHGDISPLVKIDKCSRLIWQNSVDIFHHTNEFDFEKNIWAPSEMFPYSLEKYLFGDEFGKFKDDAVTQVSPNGEILFQKSLAEIFNDNNLRSLLFLGSSKFKRDPFHLNDIQPALKNTKYWKKGDLFLSLRHLNMIVLYRPSTNKVIKTIFGPFFRQHDVDIISDKEISIFNNNLEITKERGPDVKINSEIVIYNFETDSFSKKFNKQLINNNFQTQNQGLHEILKDGELFLDESEFGRLLFFDKNGNLSWQYLNRAKNNKTYLNNWVRIIEDEDLIKKLKFELSKKCN